MSTEAHSEGFFDRSRGSNPNGNRTMTARGRTRGQGRNRRSDLIVEDGQPNDRLPRNRDRIPSVRATYRPYDNSRKHGTSVSHSHRTSQNPFAFAGSQYNPPAGPGALSSINTTYSVPSGPAAERDPVLLLDDPTPRKRRRIGSQPPTAPNTHAHPTSSAPANHEHSFSRATGPRSHATVADIAVKSEQSPLEFPVNAKRESSPVAIDTLECPPSPPLFEKLGLPEKTSGSYHVAMKDECRRGAISFKRRRAEWKHSIQNDVRFVRGHDFPPLIIEKCLIR
jgi:hypothetical protein